MNPAYYILFSAIIVATLWVWLPSGGMSSILKIYRKFQNKSHNK